MRFSRNLPEGQEVNVERTPPKDERHSDLAFAISDAFKHARQQLHGPTHVRRRETSRWIRDGNGILARSRRGGRCDFPENNI
jgi:hypothetical protein